MTRYCVLLVASGSMCAGKPTDWRVAERSGMKQVPIGSVVIVRGLHEGATGVSGGVPKAVGRGRWATW